MTSTVLPRNSLKTRITLATLSIFLVGLWSLSFYASRILYKDIERLSVEQQLSTVTMLADHVNREVEARLDALNTVALLFAPAMQDGPLAVQTLLEQRLDLQALFNSNVFISQGDGLLIAGVPPVSGMVGVNNMDREYMVVALKEGKPTISVPVVGKYSQSPIFVMTVPIRDAQGRVIGALSGTTNLGKRNFLDQITDGRYGKTGGYLLIVPQHRLIVTATDKSRVMGTLPGPGINPDIDRFMAGQEGSAVFVNPLGVEVLTSNKRIPAAGWLMAVTQPTDEAFAPIRAMQQSMQMATLLVTLLAAGLTWWLLRRQLSPLVLTSKTLADMAENRQPLRTLPIGKHDEIGQLIGGFNHLLEGLGERENALRESEERFRILHEASFGGIFVHLDGVIVDCNEGLARMTGYTVEELLGLDGLMLVAPPWRELISQKAQKGEELYLDLTGLRKDGTEYPVSIRSKNMPYKGRTIRVVEFRDITERKQAEEKLVESESRLQALIHAIPDLVWLKSPEGIYLACNQRFESHFGAQEKDIVGKTDYDFVDLEMADAFREGDRLAMQSGKPNSREEWAVFVSDGHRELLETTKTPVYDANHNLIGVLGIGHDITKRKVAEEKINTLAFFDQLTGLPNRLLFMDRLELALAASSRHRRNGALFFIDLDHFKTLNDTLGHDKGDQLLQQVAHRLESSVREGDSLARLGGDEFVLMLVDLSESAQEAVLQAEAVGEKILATLNKPYMISGNEHHGGASIGITLFSDHRETVDDLLKRADLAMYRAKDGGRNALCFFDPEMQAAVSLRAGLEADLREAVQQNQFVLFYQPQVDILGQLIGVEVLLRWTHHQRGSVSPGVFIPLAEETGLILPLGQWVLETACAQLAAWSKCPKMSRLLLAVNVSARQLRHPEFVDQVLSALVRHGVNPGRLKLELTESLLVSNIEDTVAKMTTLKANGVGFSLDDFGTGYSSLSYLKRLPLDQLKIDQSFVRDILVDPNDAVIAKTIVALGESLGLTVIAEGVETEEQRAMLASQGCLAYQGYLFSRPLPIDAFEKFAMRG